MQRSKQQWLELIDEQQGSGLSIAKFCDQKGINRKYFYARRSDFKSPLMWLNDSVHRDGIKYPR